MPGKSLAKLTGDKTFNAAVTRESRGMKRALMTPEDVAAAKDKLASDKADSTDRALREVISINIHTKRRTQGSPQTS